MLAALLLAIAGSGLTVAGTVTGAVPAMAITLPVVTAGGGHSCALMPADGSVWCWGENGFGQLGNGTTTASPVPVRVAGLPAAANVSAGQAPNIFDAQHTCAVDTASQVWCWGANAYGQLGNGTTADSKVPVQVTGGILASQVSAGDQFSCAVTLAHTAKCWGDNNYGELGDGTTTDSSTPVKVKGLTNVVQVAAGYFHACARESNGTVWCWGDNAHGELGDPGLCPGQVTPCTASDVPVIVGMQNATYIAAGHDDTCAIGNDSIWCWGSNADGQLGHGSSTGKDALAPVTVVNPLDVTKPLTGVQLLSDGGNFGCALVHNGGARCWGVGGDGELGNGTNNNSNVPVTVTGLPGKLAQVAAGFGHACALLLDGSVECWGDNANGQLGNGTTSNSNVPVVVTGLAEPVTQIAVGGSHTCALLLTGAVQCWGLGADGELGDGNSGSGYQSSTPVSVTGLTSGTSIAASGSATCATESDGSVWCWGNNLAGQLGQGPGSVGTPSFSATPLMVGGFSSNGTVGISSSTGGSACALNASQQAFCWGDDSFGELGDNDPSLTDTGTPTAVQGL